MQLSLVGKTCYISGKSSVSFARGQSFNMFKGTILPKIDLKMIYILEKSWVRGGVGRTPPESATIYEVISIQPSSSDSYKYTICLLML